MIAALRRWSRQADRAGNRGLERAYPPLLVAWHHSAKALRQAWAWLWPRLRPLLRPLLRARCARGARGAASLRGCWFGLATAASRVITPGRAAALVLVAAGALLVASQFIDYRAVEIGQPGYAGLPDVATVPTVEVRTAGAAHAYLLVPVGLARDAARAARPARARRAGSASWWRPSGSSRWP